VSAHGLEQPPEALKLLAHALRWSLLRALSVSDYRVQELVSRLEQPMNLVSYHLKQLRDAGLVTARRSEADARDVYYTLDVDHLRRALAAAAAALHPALLLAETPTEARPRRRVLFVCTHNSARSQIAEGLLRHLGGAAVEVYSAGSHPTHVHPEAVQAMDQLGINIRGQQAKHLSDFDGQSFDYVITVCDRAREICPTFPGDSQQLHWGFADPVLIEDPAARRQAFEQTVRRLQSRIRHFLAAWTEQPIETR
jgi:protein-tyrosine-phosphatase/DNA-binding transcriptional ArsR family regulator